MKLPFVGVMEKKVNTWICGNAGPLDDYNPFKITREVEKNKGQSPFFPN